MFSLATLVGSKLAIGLVTAGVVAAAGTGAAFTGVLPTAAQHAAHDLIGAPQPQVNAQAAVSAEATATAVATPTVTPAPITSPTAAPAPKATAVVPDATGPAAVDLCSAFGHGGLATSSTAYANLVSAAKGAANITTYCATITIPGNSAAHKLVAPSLTPAPVPTTAPSVTVPAPGATVKVSVGNRP
jgi:hypothetical protein